MKAFVLERYGSPLREVEMPVPVPAPHEVLVRMVASGVNHADERVRSGEFKAIFPFRLPKVMGGELSGEVVEAGSAVRDIAVGDHVYSYVDLAATGTFSEFVAADAATMAPVPRSVSLVEAAGLPVVALTAWQALVEMGKVKKGQTVLIHGGTGGVGSVAIQLAKHLGCTVATTVSTANIAAARELGADIVIDYRHDDLAQSLAGTPVDLVLDTQGGATLQASSVCCAPAAPSSASRARPTRPSRGASASTPSSGSPSRPSVPVLAAGHARSGSPTASCSSHPIAPRCARSPGWSTTGCCARSSTGCSHSTRPRGLSTRRSPAGHAARSWSPPTRRR